MKSYRGQHGIELYDRENCRPASAIKWARLELNLYLDTGNDLHRKLGPMGRLILPFFTAEQATNFHREYQEATSALDKLFLQAVLDGQNLESEQAREYVLHGLGRRLKLLKLCMSKIFRLFPPDSAKPLDPEDLHDVQISLHAFVMNLYGSFENMAWAFVYRHDLMVKIGDRKRVGMFMRSTQRFLPEPLATYLTSETMTKWHADYLKNYRDALAHRIPLYIPPATYTPAEGERYNELDRLEYEHIAAQRWGELERVREEKRGLGTACPMFLHAFAADGGSRPIYLHPQILCDVRTILEFGPIFFRHWHEREL